jgi:alpha-tubulin suppressor-like RCC1 family protein
MRLLVGLIAAPLLATGCVAIDDFGRFSFEGRGDASVPTPDGDVSDTRVPPGDSTVVPGNALADVVNVSVGVGHTCAVLGDGRLVCWGSNSEGELGQTLPKGASRISYPIEVPVSGEVHDVSTGWDFTCAVVGADRHVECFGWNDEGQLGDGSTDNRTTPLTVPGITNVARIESGRATTCVVGDLGASTGAVVCWGDNGTGQVGSGSEESAVLLPEVVSGLTGIDALSVGGSHACVIDGGQVFCWGADTCGELGLSDGNYRNTPTAAVPGLNGVTAVTAEADSTCAIAGGDLFCWGLNDQKQTGQPSGDLFETPQAVDVPSGSPTALTDGHGGGTHACAVLDDGGVICWGEANLLGAGTMDLPNGRAMPIEVSGLSGVAEVSIGSRHSCARLTDGTVRCWGNNGAGQLGTGSGTEDAFTPVTVVEVGTP